MKNEKKTLSISDIARIAGVSVATVSHVINNTGRFSAKTAEKVNAVIEKYGYISNNAARSLKLSTFIIAKANGLPFAISSLV